MDRGTHRRCGADAHLRGHGLRGRCTPRSTATCGIVESNNEAYWEDLYGLDCDKIYDGEGDEIDSWVADADYAVVIVKAVGQNVGDFANTIFEDVSEGETVWADTNGNGEFDPGG